MILAAVRRSVAPVFRAARFSHALLWLLAAVTPALGASPTEPGREPLLFVPVPGPEGAAAYVAYGDGFRLWLEAGEAVLAFSGESVVRMRPEGVHAPPAGVGRSPLPGPAERFDDVPGAATADLYGYASVRYRVDPARFAEVHFPGLYPHVDLVHYGAARQPSFDFVLRPGADARVVRYRLEGAGTLRIDASGDLLMTVDGQTIRQPAPRAYQTIDGRLVRVDCRYVLDGDTVSYALGTYDLTRVLVVSC